LSYGDRLARAVLLAAIFLASALAGALAVGACGPFFPQWLLTDEARLLEASTTWFKDAVESITASRLWDPRYRHKPEPELKAVVDAEKGPYRQTADTDQWELETLVSDRHLTARYAEVRQALLQHGQDVASWRRESAWAGQRTPPPQAPELEVPPGLPGEIADYLEGAIAYHRGDLEGARAAWEHLLERPANERRYRSTWAAFMLGKASLPKNPAAAVRWFERTRELAVQELFPDPLGLAAASYGWQARAELRLRQPDKALAHYYQQMKTGDPTALESMRFVAAKVLNDPKGLELVARSDDARPIMTAYVISVWDRAGDGGALDPAPARQWLAAIRNAQPRNVPDADRLAWVAYRAGDFTAAEEWLRRAQGGPMAGWIETKLLMRAGKLDGAERSFWTSGSRLPPNIDPSHDPFTAYEHGVQPALRPRWEAEQGASLLARGKYTEALGTLLSAGYWSDAAYIAERVLTTDELRAYADKSWPAALASHRPDSYGDGWTLLYGGLFTPSRERMAYLLRYLVGRRLAREERYAEAEKFLPTSLRLPLHTLADSMAEGRDAHRPAAERAQSLFLAACVCRHQGLALLGTELDPDWFVYEGQYENPPFAQSRINAKFQRLGPTQDEKDRAIRSQVEPAKRFHYRYRAMDLAQEAAALLPDGSEERARMLATAGNWIEGRDADAAKPLLAAILSCCGNTDVGRRARRVNAIPNIEDACPAEIQRRREQ
jgi:hypothetical protein